MKDKELYGIAKDALKNAYAPFSKYRVGAALLGKSGKVYTGVNVENSSFGCTICAERTACVKAVSEGEQSFQKIAVAIDEGEATPCGICRQFLFEFAQDLEIVTGPDEDHLRSQNIRDLLVGGFKL